MNTRQAIIIGPDEIPSGYDSLVEGSITDQLDGLGRALLASPGWPESVDVVLSEHPGPVLVIVGLFDDDARSQVDTLRTELTATRVRYVDYREAEAVAEELAIRLRHALRDIDAWKFAAIPRGGLFALGLLSYFLDLRADQIVTVDGSDDPLVIVDDIALSGRRLRETMHRAKGKLAVATLFSVPELRSVVTRKEPRVDSFVSGTDIIDIAPELYGADYGDWFQRWSSRSDDYWVGRTEHLVFPWTEPDITIWNEALGHPSLAWRLAPPDRCLKNRAATRPARTVHRFQKGTGPVRQGASVVDLRTGETVTIVDLGSQRTLTLSGTGADMWSALISSPDLGAAALRIRQLYEADEDQVRHDLAEFSRFLSAEGLIAFEDVDESA